MSFDIEGKEKASEIEELGTDVPIDDEDGHPQFQSDGETPITIRIVGSLSKRYRRAQEAQRHAAIHRQRGKKLTGAESLRQQTEFVADLILGWSPGFVQTIDGAKSDLPFNKDNAIALMTKFPFIQAQLESAVEDHGAFFTKRSTI